MATASAAKSEDSVPPAAGPPHPPEKPEPMRVLAFSGGSFDTVMQLGVTHALVVSRSRKPDLVAGISAGAIGAASLADVLQAGDEVPDEEGKVLAQVARFREVLESYLDAPQNVLRAFLPDPLEVAARAPLKELALPIHPVSERDERAEVTLSRFGLIRLFNAILAIRLSLSTLTRFVRLFLELKQLPERHAWPMRVFCTWWELFRIWLLGGLCLPHLATPVYRIVSALLLCPLIRNAAELTEAQRQGWPNCHGLKKFLNETRLCFDSGILGIFGVRANRDAKALLMETITLRRAKQILTWLFGFFVTVGAWTIAIVIWLPWPLWSVVGTCGRGLSGLRSKFSQPDRPDRSSATSDVPWIIRKPFRWLLASLSIEADLATPFLLKPILVRLFDPNYYGEPDMVSIVESALTNEAMGAANTSAPKKELKRRTLTQFHRKDGGDGEAGDAGILVAPIAVDVASGKTGVLPQEMPVVDALLAATAIVPYFRAQKFKGKTYIDCSNVSREPIIPVIDFLIQQRRQQQIPDALPSIEMFAVTPYPLDDETLDCGGADFQSDQVPSLLKIVQRAVDLQKWQDARMERMLVRRYRQAITAYQKATSDPEPSPFVTRTRPVPEDSPDAYVRIELRPIEPDRAPRLNQRLFSEAGPTDDRRMVAEAVADGCRRTLEVILHNRILENSKESDVDTPCRHVIAARLNRENDEVLLPGGTTTGGPGIPEVCRNCSIFREPGRPAALRQDRPHVPKLRRTKKSERAEDWPCRIPSPAKSTEAPPNPGPAITPASNGPVVEVVWPTNPPRKDPPAAPASTSTVPPGRPEKPGSPWPLRRDDSGQVAPEKLEDPDRPTVSLLFSGGVFRGVFQIGVVNALHEAGVFPDLVAGSSVGSITAAMVASVFAKPDELARRRQLALLAGAFLTIDRLVLTDRFSDFIRRFTLRAGDAHFSIRDADHCFRQYDARSFEHFNEGSRRVFAGIERLFMINPFALLTLAKHVHARNWGQASRLAAKQIQAFADGFGVGREFLGAEPLDLLIKHLVLKKDGQPEKTLGFDYFLSQGIHFLATTTNLTRGELKVLTSLGRGDEFALLRPGLLASSAFPAVFRPRWAWEIFPQASRNDLYVDGGVMDNLPLDALVRFLHDAAKNKRILRHPKAAPHLLFTASLEPHVPQLTDEAAEEVARYWPALRTRAQQLRYNKKFQAFAEAQQDFRELHRMTTDQAPAGGDSPNPWPLLNLHAVMVEPAWLCGTFAFHPMLNFKRHKQAASIAHGCAATLAKLHQLEHPEHPDLDGQRKNQTSTDWSKAWIRKKLNIREKTVKGGLFPDTSGQRGKEGVCWFRDEGRCPFSTAALNEITDLAPAARHELSQIYKLCGQRRTHTTG